MWSFTGCQDGCPGPDGRARFGRIDCREIRAGSLWVEFKQCRIVVQRRLSYKYQSNPTVLLWNDDPCTQVMKRPQCFEILDLDPSVSLQELRTAYRDLVSVWHPDRYAHNPRLQQKAEQKLRQLNAAFEEARLLIETRAEMRRTESGAGEPAREAPSKCPPSMGQTDLKKRRKNPFIEAPSQNNGPAAWQATEAALQTIYMNRARREYRQQGHCAENREPSQTAINDAPRRRRIGEVPSPRGSRNSESNSFSEDRMARWSAVELHLKTLASARPAAPQPANESPSRRASPRKGWRGGNFRRAAWTAGAIFVLAAAGALVWCYWAPLSGRVVEMFRLLAGG